MTTGRTATDPVRLHVFVSGRVQGVGFRYWAREQARALGLTGLARNLRDGRVEMVAEGARSDCERLVSTLRCGGTPGDVLDVDVSWSAAQGAVGFEIG